MVQEMKRQNPDVDFAEPAPMEPLAIDTHADDLMDEIFGDVDRVLEGGSKLPKDSAQPEFISLQSIKVPQIILPAVETEAETEGALSSEVNLRDARADRTESFDRILLGAACASLVVTLSLWLATRGGLGRLFAPAPVAVAPSLDAQTRADGKFVDYLERSLAAIEGKATTPQIALQGFPGSPPVMNLPTLPIPDAPPSNPDTTALANTNNLIAAINRVAEAVQEASDQTASLSNQVMATLQAQTRQNQQPPQPTPTPGGQASGADVQAEPEPTPTETATATPEPEPAATPTTSPAATIPAPPTPSSIPAPPPASPSAPAAPPEQTAAASDTTEPQSGAVHTLVGILELGDRSAALFEVNGVARRIYVGESVAASGWTLVEVVNQEAVIRRNGEVRTIFVGEQF
ncbi:hypothetical protein [Lyngbya sp. CCY1209]|uniref:hypothetical protein n=1 Tax=Lyngbya sp. CCY1209 TaxID=2886103 RepID=UPI002D1FD22D|nr:hypothetical protein [Lyngbya sp. CCY1209]MEB3886912.1 hypothetical protein [Lyngbya sp. CCY1209]